MGLIVIRLGWAALGRREQVDWVFGLGRDGKNKKNLSLDFGFEFEPTKI
jgi:hypothetical protein